MSTTPEQLLAAGDPAGALSALQKQVRANAGDVKLRIFLFQLLALLGQWQRALDQLKVCGDMDAATLAMTNTYLPAVQCETVREAVFAGRATPHVFGPPAAWVAHLAQALLFDAQGHPEQAAAERALALEEAPTSAGQINDQRFEWIADADSRLGPVLEVVINGRYGWLPFMHLAQINIEPVADLRDLVWAPAHLSFTSGGDTVALLPVRYAGSTEVADAALQMSRKTDWLPLAADQYRGLGQRVLATDAVELGLLEVRQITLDPLPADAAAAT
jgi:type VI secretion system protein ImpE